MWLSVSMWIWVSVWITLLAIVLWFNRRSRARCFSCLSAVSQKARLLFQQTFKLLNPSSFWRQERTPKSRKCFCLVLLLLLLLLSAFALHLTVGQAYKNWLDKENKKLGFYRVQTAMDALIAKDGVTLKQILDPMESMITGWFPVLSCEEDKSLLQQQPAQDRVLVAANLVNCVGMMPNFVLQILKLVSLFDEDQVRVSIYESGSTDLTPSWLALLKRILTVSNITSVIIFNGEMVKHPEDDRIVFLTKIRNEAIAPMLEWNQSPNSWTAQKVVFTNDVYFCPQQILRLLVHKDEDVVCGMDFDIWKAWMPWPSQIELIVQNVSYHLLLPKALIRLLIKVKYFQKRWEKFLSHGDLVRLKVPLFFYDRWAATDIKGRNLRLRSPFTTDAFSNEIIRGGFPFYVHTCWNALVALNAKPLLQGLHFRVKYEGECVQSECFFICHDYIRLGFGRIMIDPGVRVAYEYDVAEAAYDSDYVKEMPFVPWDAKGVRDHIALTKQHPTNVSCCVLPDGTGLDLEACASFDYSKYHYPK